MRPYGQFNKGIEARRNDTGLRRAEPGRAGRLRARSLAARVLTAVLLAAFAALLALPAQAQELDDATLSALTVSAGTSDVDLLNPGFISTETSYRTAVKYRDERLTVTATTTNAGATIEFLDRSDAILDDADFMTSDHQMDVPVGDWMFKVRVTAEDSTTTKVYEVVVERDSAHLFGWTPTRDLNGLAAAGNESPQGIWSDGTTIWVADDEDDMLYAYTLATGVREMNRDIMLAGDNQSPRGIWSDKTTVWVADDEDDKLYAYALSDGTRQDGTNSTVNEEFSLHTDNGAPWGIWSDGTIIWVTNGADPILYAYALDDGTRQDGTDSTTNIEFKLNGASLDARGIWSDGSTLWVSSSAYSSTKPLMAYTLDFSSTAVGNLHGVPDRGKSFYTPGTLQLMGAGIWSDGDTAIWMASAGPAGKIYSFNTLPTLPSKSGSVSLSSLTVSAGNGGEVRFRPPGFNINDVVHWASVVNDVNVVTVSAIASDTAAMVEYVDKDGNQIAPGQVDVMEGRSHLIGILVTAPDGAALIHQVFVERDSARSGGWTPTKDILGLDAAGITTPTGIWSDGDTMWVVDYRDFKLYAYTLDTGLRDESKEFDLDSANNNPWGLWSDGKTIWVGSRSTVNLKLFAYTLKDDITGTDEKGQRDATKDITLDASNTAASGIWSNGTDTVWVVDQSQDKLYAYTLDIVDGMAGTSHGERKEASDISLQDQGLHYGIWSDGTTVWVGNNGTKSFRAYTLANGEQEESKDIPFAPFHGNTQGVWSNGSTLWSADNGDSRIYSHTLPVSEGATTLSNLTVTPSPEVSSFTATLRPTFSSDTDIYGVAVPNAVEFVTISPTLSDISATVAYEDEDGGTLADADSQTMGHQVNVPVGTSVINIKITKMGVLSITYTVVVERDSAERFGWTPTRDLNTFYQDNPEAAGQTPRAVWGDGTTLYVAPNNTAKLFAFDPTDGTRRATKDIVTTSDFVIDPNGKHESILFAGIWSDGTTMWVVDYHRVHNEHGMDYEPSTVEQAHGKLFAYSLNGGARDKSKEFVLDSIHQAGVRGVWSNGTTVWVSDYKLGKLIAYTLGTGARVQDSDIILHSDNAVPQGIWSDGTTIWVADWDDDKFYAYLLDTGARAESKDFSLAPGNGYPRDVWSDGTTMWVPDSVADKLFSYRMTDGTTTTPGITVSETALTVTEEETTGDSYTVVLDSQPTAAVTVTVAGHAGTDVTPNPTTLTFATSNWNTAQTVTVTAGDDTDTTTDMVTLTHSATSTDGSYDGITIASVTVTVTDNDTANLVVSTSSLTVGEAGSDTFTVKLATQPSGSVTVSVTSDDTGAATASPASLTFTTGNWNTVQTVTVSGVDDSDTDNENVTVSLSASGGDYSDTVIASVTVTVTDNDDDTAAGICGRTPAVRDALMALIPGVSDCAAVTAAELAAITGTLDLSSQSITALAAGDFAGLTSLEALYLFNNKLTSLPDGVFEPLIALEVLYLQGNREAPFAPTADARPDDGTVPVAGGKVTLDGSGSGGPWGSNVSYSWALTTPASGVTVTFDNATSAMPEVTIPALTEGIELTFTLTVTGRGGTDGIETDTDTAKVTATLNITNAAPVFREGGSTSRTFNETIGDTAVTTATDIGMPVSAMDPDSGDTLTYSLEGADAARFGIIRSSGQIRTKAGERYSYETDTSYSATVKVVDSSGSSDTITVTLNVTDQDEPPLTMNLPAVSATPASTPSLEVSWTEPTNTGRPNIDSYDLQYREVTTGDFIDGPQNQSGMSAAIGNLTADTEYEVQVRATNAEGDGPWSQTRTGTTAATPGITVSETALTVTEEETTGDSYTVVLDSQPTAAVTVTVAGHAGTDVTPNPTTLTFATSNWNTAQTVTVTAGDDTDTTTDMVTLTHSATSTDGSYDGITIASVTVTVTDNDTANLVVSTSSLTVGEAGSDTFTVKLATQPSGSVTVSVTSDDTGAATASPASLTFTTGNWNTVQTVTVSGVDDSDTAAENVTVSLSASGGDYSDTVIASVTVTVTDNDDDTAAGICGRTPAVRDALMALIPGVSDCAAVTAAELAAITDTLDLSSQSITALAAGDFAGLTALKTLNLFNNELTSLPDDVFAGLTALETLNLDHNKLTTLPSGVFGGLTALKLLYLNNNMLTALPTDVFGGLTALEFLYLGSNELTALPTDVFGGLTALKLLYLNNNMLDALPNDVFEPLTALEALQLRDNPGALFAPTADARPDDGTVPVAGGKVTLDGSGSSGPWGTNVTYRWALTTPVNGVTVMFDDARSVTPVVTIPVLAEDTELTFTLTVTGRGGINGISTDTDTAKVTATLNITNNPPMFAGGPVQGRTLAETVGNATVGTAAAIGAPVSASDVDTGDTLTYTLMGDDRDNFIFDTSSGQIKTKVGEKYDYEAKPSYSVTVTVNDGTVTVSAAVTISVTDQNEAPLASDAPVASATSGSTTSLEVSWTAPDNTGRPGITSYDLQYQVQGASSWTNGPQDVSGTSASITGLVPDTKYEVQVRATNAEGDGAWSVAGGGTTGTTTPGITVSETALTVTEEETTGDSYTVVLDSQPTADVVVTIAGHSGTDVTPNPTTLTFATSNWNTAQTVTVTAGDDTDTTTDMVTLTHSATSTDGSYDGITIASVTVTVTDNDTANLVVSTSSLTVGEAGSDTFTVKLATQPSGQVDVTVSSSDTGAATVSPASLTFTTTDWNATQEVTVSGVDDSDTDNESLTVTLSASGGDYAGKTGTVSVSVTDDDTTNAAPTFTEGFSTSRSFNETIGAAAVSTAANIGTPVAATDANTGDTLNYSLEGADAARFGIIRSSGQIRTKAGERYSYETKQSYMVTVEVVDVNGASDTITVTLNVTDQNEQPSTPGSPAVTATSGSTTSLDVRWAQPSLNYGPNITGYRVEYRKGRSGTFTAKTHSGTGTATTITGLEAGTLYQVQVRALNGETPSDWSPTGEGTTANATDVDEPKAPRSMYIYFTEKYGENKPLNGNARNTIKADCSVEKYFRAYWSELNDSEADEWGISRSSYYYPDAEVVQTEFRYTAGINKRHPEFIGKVRLSSDPNGHGSISFKIRGRYGEVWSDYSPVSTLGCIPLADEGPSTDATLSDLALEDGDGNAIPLAFASDDYEYEVSVVNGIDAVTLTATKNDSNAMVVITDDDDDTPDEAEDTTVLTYTVNVARAAAIPHSGQQHESDFDR